MAHIHEKIDWTVGVFVVHNNKVLIRLHEKYNLWLAVGGHVELDEDANQAAIREVKEEVGLDITLIPPPHIEPEDMTLRGEGFKELVPPFYMNIHQINDVHQHHDLIFVATSNSDAVVPENPTDKWVWLSKKEVESHPDLLPDIRREALMALRMVGKLS